MTNNQIDQAIAKYAYFAKPPFAHIPVDHSANGTARRKALINVLNATRVTKAKKS